MGGAAGRRAHRRRRSARASRAAWRTSRRTFNKTIVTITDTNGETISWASAGTQGFKGARKSTPFAAGRAAENAASTARKSGMVEVEVKVKGPGAGREQAIIQLQHAGLKVTGIEGRDPAAPQRLPPAEEAARVRRRRVASW
jgi:small subunit ribosomal protein S11